MKRRHLLQVLCLLISCLYSNTYAQTAKFTINGQSVNLEIEGVDPTEYKITEINDTCSILEYTGEIERVKFFETDSLKQRTNHIIKGDEKKITSTELIKEHSQGVKFKPSDHRIIYVIVGDQTLHQYITYKVKKLSQDEINDKINIEPQEPTLKSGKYSFSESDTITTIYYYLKVNLPVTFSLNDIKVLVDDESMDFEWSPKQGGMTSSAKSGPVNISKKTTIRIKVENSALKKDSVQIKLLGNVTSKFLKESEVYEKDLITLYKYTKPKNIWDKIRDNWYILIVGIIGLLVAIILSIFIGKWNKKRKEKTGENDGSSNILLSEIEKLKEEKENTEEERDNYKSSNKNLQNQLNECKEKIKTLKTTNNQLKNNLSNTAYLKKILEVESIPKKEARLQLNQIRNELIDKEKKLELLSNEYTELKTFIVEKNNKLKKLESQVDDFQGTVDKMKSDLKMVKQCAGQKNIYYLHVIKDTLAAINIHFNIIFSNMEEGEIRQQLVNPLMRGIDGLSSGITSYSDKFENDVLNNMNDFFEADFYTLKEEEVKKILANKFLINIVKLNSFSKFTRLYLLSTVPWIRVQLEDTGFDVENYAFLFHKLQAMIEIFGIRLIYPKLFKETFSDHGPYQWYEGTDIFELFRPSDELRKTLSHSSTIIDLIQLGVESEYGLKRRATIATPNF